jgi:hypothetical protein
MIASDTAVVDTQYQLTSLEYFTTYFWHVRSLNAKGKSRFSPVTSFTTSPAPLSSPVFTDLPMQDGLMPLEFTLGWSPIPEATRYHLQIALDSLYRSLEVDDSTLTSTVRNVGPLRHAARYFMRLRALGRGGTFGPFGNSVQFTASAFELEAPVMQPLPGQQNQQPVAITAAWLPSPGATHYHLQLATDPLFTMPVVDDSMVTDTVRHLGPLRDATTYYLRVQATNSIARSTFSIPMAFTTSAGELGVPFIVAGAGQSSNRPVFTSIQWLSVPGAVHYHFQLSTDLQFTTLIQDDSTLTDTVAQVGPLSNATTYFVRVRALNDRARGAFSVPYSFSTIAAAPPAPGAIGIVSEPQTTSVILSWQPVPGALTYHLQVSKDSLFAAPFVDDSTLADTAKSIASLEPLTRYCARVRTKGVGGIGAFGPSFAFTTAGTPPPANVPPDYMLEQNFPNPFNPTTTIRYAVPAPVHVRIVLFNALGQRVKILVDQEKPAGRYEVEFTRGQLASGTYFYIFEAGDYVQTRKLLVVK